MMKLSTSLALCSLLYSGASFGQNSAVVSAYNHNKSGKYAEAKEAIDKAVEHPKTNAKSKTWRYRGNIYFNIFNSETKEVVDLSNNPMKEAASSFKKAMELDPKGSYNKEMEGPLMLGRSKLINKGVEHFQNKAYPEAFSQFETAIFVSEVMGEVDSVAIFNAALSAEGKGDLDLAAKFYQKAIDINYGGANTYSFLSSVYQRQEKVDETIAVIQKGREAYPNDENLIREESNIFLKTKDYAKAEESIKASIEKDPTNHVLHFSLGSVYDNLKKYDQAETAYKKALEIDPEYFEANFNIGALYFNKGVAVNNEANEIKDNKLYKKKQAEANIAFEKAIPYLEKARSLNGSDRDTLMSLKQLYGRLGQTDKYNEIKAVLEKI